MFNFEKWVKLYNLYTNLNTEITKRFKKQRKNVNYIEFASEYVANAVFVND